MVSPDTVRQQRPAAFSDTINPDGSQGFFYPDNFTFGQPVYLSSIYQVATSITGVVSVVIGVFQRYGKEANGELAAGEVTIAASEVAEARAHDCAPTVTD